MNIFEFRHRLIQDYAAYTRSFVQIRDDDIRNFVWGQLESGVLWPDPLIQLNPSFEPGSLIDELTAEGLLHPECSRVFRIKPEPASAGQPLRLHRHQADAIRIARGGHPYVLTTGTGSGTALVIVDRLRRQRDQGIVRALGREQSGCLPRVVSL
jgi:ATP-dependent helicase YprA (DUF1998 family)